MTVSAAARIVLFSLACLSLAACTQTTGGTAVSTYSGNLADTAVSDKAEQRRAAKRAAARKRAAKKREESRKAFEKKRAQRQAAREKEAKPAHKSAAVVARRSSAKKATGRKRKTAAKRVVKKKPVQKAKQKPVAKAKKSVAKAASSVAPIKASFAATAGARVATSGKPWNCVPGRLKTVLGQVARKYGRVTVNSTHRSKGNNRKAGGKRRSYHLKCAAVDFRVHGKTKGLTRFLANHKLVGGYKRYKSGFYHIDTGPKRTW